MKMSDEERRDALEADDSPKRLLELQFWLWATNHNIAELRRLSDLKEAFFQYGDTENFSERRTHQNLVALARNQMFTAAGKASRIVEVSTKAFPAILEPSVKHAALLRAVRDTRDMNEHSEEYFTGVGRFQENFEREIAGPQGFPGAGARLDATSVIDDNYGGIGLNTMSVAFLELERAASTIPMPPAEDPHAKRRRMLEEKARHLAAKPPNQT